ncbi:MAG: AAA family ATPase [Sulfurovum sp.]
MKQTLTVNSVYLPASRTGYLQTYKTLANQAVFKSYNLDDEKNKNHLSIIIRFFITQLNTNTKFKNSEFSDFIENLIMKGRVGIFEDNNNIEFKLKNGDSINLNYLSSTVSELIPLVVFLKRGIIKRNGLLVIEEPEAHLSFENQKLMAKLIALFLQNDIKVLITTHSDFLIYELNNLIMKDTIIKNKDKVDIEIYENNIQDEISIEYKKIALYNFILNDNKSIIKRVKIDKYGINNKYIFDNTYSIIKEKNQFLDILDLIDA